jgi:hypothetical protein
MGEKRIMQLKPGSRWKSAVCDTEVVVMRPPKSAGQLECGGAAMLEIDSTRTEGAAPAAGADSGTLLGKRYGDTQQGLEVLCTKAGAGALSLDGRRLELRAANRLPSSD